jgi:hypothetical protein
MEGGHTFEQIHNRIAAELSGSGPSDDPVKEVYARFGLAYYHCEVLHRCLCNFYCFSQLPAAGPVTGPRVEEHLQTAFDSTLGQLLERLKPVLPPPLLPKLQVALERRNFIAHRFWYERIHLMTSIDGIQAMVEELSLDSELFSELDKEVEKLTEPFHARLGVTPELFDRALAETLSGTACEPLIEQRKPKKEEIVIAVFDVPTRTGRSVLIFQTEDGLLWQLCDVGLGWCPYKNAEPSWPKARKFIDLLPAKINPRPKASAPWTFEIHFGRRAKLSVRPGQGGQILYQLLRK